MNLSSHRTSLAFPVGTLRRNLSLASAVGAITILCSCETTTPLPVPDERPPAPVEVQQIIGQATVDSVRVLKLESFPVEAFVYVTGYLPDPATKIAEKSVQLVGNEFVVSIATSRPSNAIAVTQLVPFEERISLPIEGLAAGSYSVSVNGQSTEFRLDRLNSL